MPHRAANRLLGSLTDAERRRWCRAAEPVRMARGQVLEAPGEPSPHVWFPTSATVSILYATESGASGEIALVGDEGVIGRSLPPGPGTSRGRAVVSDAGEGFRIDVRFVLAELERPGSLAPALMRFAEAMLAQTSQLVVCNRHHRLEQQLCRLLLSSVDRTASPLLETTHEWLATRLGVRREGVSGAVRRLREVGALGGRRGRIEVIDRSALEARSCECYALIAAGRDRTFH